jgi:hypothetical protein
LDNNKEDWAKMDGFVDDEEYSYDEQQSDAADAVGEFESDKEFDWVAEDDTDEELTNSVPVVDALII